jgi:hypothetical protein
MARFQRLLVRGTVTALAAVLALVAGCSAEPANDAAPTTDSAPAPEQSEPITLGDLPVDPGVAWDVAQYDGMDPIPVDLQVAGPWVMPDPTGWPVATARIVDPAGVQGIEQIGEYDFVVRTEDFGIETFYPRAIRDGWMLQLGRVDSASGTPMAEAYAEPLRLWPVTFEVGDEFVVLEGENFRVDATVLAQSTVTVPAGEIGGAYLVRYMYTPLTAGAIEGTNYQILAPDIGFVAAFSAAEGDEAAGFTAIETAQVLVSLPEQR